MGLGQGEIFLVIMSLANVEKKQEAKRVMGLKRNGSKYIIYILYYYIIYIIIYILYGIRMEVKNIPICLIRKMCLLEEHSVRCHQKRNHKNTVCRERKAY